MYVCVPSFIIYVCTYVWGICHKGTDFSTLGLTSVSVVLWSYYQCWEVRENSKTRVLKGSYDFIFFLSIYIILIKIMLQEMLNILLGNNLSCMLASQTDADQTF